MGSAGEREMLVEPAPETVPDALVEELVELLDVVELELEPHAARPSASSATPASVPILFLITASPLIRFPR